MNFKITQVKLVNPIVVGGIPEDLLLSDKFECVLSEDPRFLAVKAKIATKHPFTLTPLTNVAYMFITKTEDKPVAKIEKVKK